MEVNMSSLFSGLDKFGLARFEQLDLYEKDEKTSSADTKRILEEKKIKQPEEADFLFDKTYVCPVCDHEFQARTIRTGHVKLLSADIDLRPKYQGVDCLKYDAIVCPGCGFASLSRFFKFILPAQAKMIKTSISANFRGIEQSNENFYTYDDAISRHQLALLNAVVKKAKNSEKAYTCLKLGWLYRGKAENLPETEKDREKTLKMLQLTEKDYLKKAYVGFRDSFSTESFPLCGMDEDTMEYLLAVLAYKSQLPEESGRWVSKVLTSRTASNRLKDKGRDLKELLEAKE